MVLYKLTFVLFATMFIYVTDFNWLTRSLQTILQRYSRKSLKEAVVFSQKEDAIGHHKSPSN